MTPIEPGTKIKELLDAYPYLLDFLGEYNPHFKRLQDPAHREMMAGVATVEIASGAAGVPLQQFIADLRAEVERCEGGQGATTAPVGTDRRQEVLRGLIRDLHQGADFDDVKSRFAQLIQEVEPGEIAAMEQALMAEGMPAEEIQRLCDVHVSVFRESLDTQADLAAPVGHAVHTFMAENRVAADIISRLRRTLEEVTGRDDGGGMAFEGIRTEIDKLADVERHYLRKENQLFPVLERHGITGPTRVMWALHDDIRAVFREFREAAEGGERAEAVRLVDQILTMMEDMIYKEEKILFPTGLDSLSTAEWDEIKSGEAAIGYSWPDEIEAEIEARPGQESLGGLPAGQAARAHAALGTIPLTTGALTPDMLDLVLRNLPFDITVVDENDRVLYYSEGERVFPRSPAVIGREVHNCHPPKSVHVVERIVQEFREGARSRADFWIKSGGRFVVIRYFALRDDEGSYRGVLEVVQDVTWQRGLTGEQRLIF
jgi:uncharacterized protein